MGFVLGGGGFSDTPAKLLTQARRGNRQLKFSGSISKIGTEKTVGPSQAKPRDRSRGCETYDSLRRVRKS
jgi:hypothetical protein